MRGRDKLKLALLRKSKWRVMDDGGDGEYSHERVENIMAR